jgi:hypothetical protein
MYDVVPDEESTIRSNEVASVVAITRRFGVRNMSYADTLIHYSYKQNTLCSMSYTKPSIYITCTWYKYPGTGTVVPEVR